MKLETIHQRIYFLRHMNGRQTMAQFADALTKAVRRDTPFHANTINDWEHKAQPNLEGLAAIRKLTGARYEWLIDGTGEPLDRAEKHLGAA